MSNETDPLYWLDHPDTPLHRAVRAGDTQAVTKLLCEGTKVDAPGVRGETALFVAVEYFSIEMVKLLLAHGADPNANPSGDLMTPMTRAAQNSQSWLVETPENESLQLLIRSGGRITPREAIILGDVATIARLCQEGADPNSNWTLNDYSTNLTIAAQSGRAKVAAALIDHGANPNRPADLGITALMLAASNDHPEMVALLLARGADIGAQDQLRRTAFGWAALGRHLRIIRLLLEHNARPTLTDAILFGDLNFVGRAHAELQDQDLLRCIEGAYVAEAAELGNLDIVRYLLDRGDPPNPTKWYKSFPLQLAIEHGHDEVAKFLRSRGAVEAPSSEESH